MGNNNIKKNRKSRTLIMRRFGLFVILIQGLFSLFGLLALYKANVIPGKYFLLVCVVVGLLFLSVGVWVLRTRKFTPRIVSLLLSIVMLIGSYYALKTSEMIGEITGANTNTHIIHVVVMKESSAETFSDVEDEVFGANTTQDSQTITRAKALIKEQNDVDIDVEGYTSYASLVDDLYNGTLKVLIISEAHTSFAKEYDEFFSEKTRIIASYQYDEEVVTRGERPEVLDETYSIFLSGIDTYGPVSTVSRSDVNMIITVNPKTNQILLTSLPRDYYITLATYKQKDKLTHAGIYGVDESMKTLEKLLGTDIDFYIRVNFTSLTKIVDALGGVDVYTKYNFVTLHGAYTFKEGYNHVDGFGALGFVRERYSLPDGDNDRIWHQQQLIQAILDKAMSPAIITRFSSVMNSVSGSVQMSLTEHELTSIIRYQMSTMENWDIQQFRLTGTNDNAETYSWPGHELSVIIPNESSVKQAARYIQQMEDGETVQVKE